LSLLWQHLYPLFCLPQVGKEIYLLVLKPFVIGIARYPHRPPKGHAPRANAPPPAPRSDRDIPEPFPPIHPSAGAGLAPLSSSAGQFVAYELSSRPKGPAISSPPLPGIDSTLSAANTAPALPAETRPRPASGIPETKWVALRRLQWEQRRRRIQQLLEAKKARYSGNRGKSSSPPTTVKERVSLVLSCTARMLSP
jgi:hypothetical protein